MSTQDEDLSSSDYFEEGVLREANSCPIIRDKFDSLKAVSQAIRQEGVRECGLLFGIDYTISNRMQGLKSFGGKSLHDVSSPVFNPYQQIICIFGETLESFDDDGMIPVFGFGDAMTKGESVFSLKETGDCKGFDEVLNVYNTVTPTVKMSGPTNLEPVIKKAIEICKETKKHACHTLFKRAVLHCQFDNDRPRYSIAFKRDNSTGTSQGSMLLVSLVMQVIDGTRNFPDDYHILVIAADGQISDEEKTKEVLVEASKFPLSIIMVGVGDGPWEIMKEFDDGLPERSFDNFQFVNFHEVMSSNARNPQAALALHALMEIPDQYKAIKELGII